MSTGKKRGKSKNGKTSFVQFQGFIDYFLGIKLGNQLEFHNKSSINNYSLTSSIVMLYRYAEKLDEKIQVRDAISGGHKSHGSLKTECDFDLLSNAVDWRPRVHIKLATDLLSISDLVRHQCTAFRVGCYFDYFRAARKGIRVKNSAGKNTHPFEKWDEIYGKDAAKSGASMHLGVRYDFRISRQYRGPGFSAGVRYGMWGRGGTREGTGNWWAERFKDWDQGYLSEAQRKDVAGAFLYDCQRLDKVAGRGPLQNLPDQREPYWNDQQFLDEQRLNGLDLTRQARIGKRQGGRSPLGSP